MLALVTATKQRPSALSTGIFADASLRMWGKSVGMPFSYRQKRTSERGEGKFKAILVTAILVFLIFAAVKMVPPYVAEYQLADKMQETARYASVTRSTPDQIKDTIFREMQDLNIPATREELVVTSEGGRVAISLDYKVPIDLLVYKFELHFTPSSSNKDTIFSRLERPAKSPFPGALG